LGKFWVCDYRRGIHFVILSYSAGMMLQKRLAWISIWLVLATTAIGLVLMAALGLHNRYWSDDWCYERDLHHLGILPTMGGYFFTGDDAIRGYSTNRYSLTLITAILYLPGMIGTQILGTLLIGCLVGALYLVVNNIFRGSGQPRTISVLTALFVAYYAFFISPARFQVLYWRAGVHYTATIIVALLMLAIVLSSSRGDGPGIQPYLALAALGFVGGGLSETGCVYLLSAFSVLLMAAWIGKRQGAPWAVNAFPLIGVVLSSLVLAVLALILSPSNDRYRVHVDHPIPFYLVPSSALDFAVAFIVQSFRSLPLPHLMFGAYFVSLAILVHHLFPGGDQADPAKALKRGLITVAVAFILITAIQLPAAYFYGAPLDARGQSLSRFTMLAGLAVLGWLTGQQLGTSGLRAWVVAPAVISMLAISVYSSRLIGTNYAELDGFVERARIWDARDAMIREAVSRGELLIEVPVIDTHAIGTRDLIRSIVMNSWTTNCATEYYGAQAFRAIPP